MTERSLMNYETRLSGLLRIFLARGHAPQRRGALHRRSIANDLGCSETTLSRNARLQQQLDVFERSHLSELDNSFEIDDPADQEVDSINVDNIMVFASLEKVGRIIFTKVVYKEETYDVPSLIWPSGIDEVVCDWLRHITIQLGRTKGTAEDCAKAVRQFTLLREELGIAWEAADDETLRVWKTRMEGKGNDPKYINKYIGFIHAFYRWAEETGRLKNRVEVVDRHFLPDELKKYKFPISSHRVGKKNKHGHITSEWRSTIFSTGGRSSEGTRNTPTEQQFETLLDLALDDPVHGTRNSLLLSWAHDTGGRVHEILQIQLSDLPKSDDDFRRMREMGFWPIAIKRKGPKHRKGTLRPPYDLVMRTISYTRTERAQLATFLKGKVKGPCKAVFLSAKGGALSADSATRICGKLFKAAGVLNANIHRLRAKFAQTMVEASIEALQESGIAVNGTSNWHETALTMAMEMMGHSSIRSLRPYLNRVMKRRVDVSETGERTREEGAQRERRLLERQQIAALEGNATLARIGVLLRTGDNDAARRELVAFAAELKVA